MRALVTGGLGFVGRHLVAHLRGSGDEVDGHRPPRRARGRHHRRPAVRDRHRRGRARRRVPPGRAGPTSAARGATRSAAFRANAEGTLNVLLACAASRRGPRAVGRQRRRLRRGDRGGAPAHRGVAPPPGQPVRRQQGRRRLPRRCRRSSATASGWSGSGRSTTSGPARPSASWRPPSRPASPPTSATAATPSPSATSRPAATSPTCATSCAPTGCSSSAARRARSTTCAPARDLAVQDARRPPAARWPTDPCALVTDPALLRPVDVPVLRGDATQAARRHRLGARDPDRADARRPARRHAARRTSR